MPLLRRAEHEVVARRAPRRLLEHFDVGHAVLGEEALLLGDQKRGCVGERDEAELRLWSPRGRRLARMAPAGNCVCSAPSSAAVPALAFRNVRRLRPRRIAVPLSDFFVIAVVILFGVGSARRPLRATQKSRSLKQRFALPPDQRRCCMFSAPSSLAAPVPRTRLIQAPCQAPASAANPFPQRVSRSADPGRRCRPVLPCCLAWLQRAKNLCKAVRASQPTRFTLMSGGSATRSSVPRYRRDRTPARRRRDAVDRLARRCSSVLMRQSDEDWDQ